MKRVCKSFASFIGVLIVLMGSSSTSAATVTYNFGTVLSGTGPNISFATLVIDDSLDEFTFTPAVDLSVFGADAFIGSLAVDYSGAAVSAAIASGVWGVGSVSSSPGGGPGGSFDFRYVFGGGSDKLKSGETLKWISTDFDLTKLSGLALHVQGVDTGNGFSSSIWYSPVPVPVPEPETYAMMLAGLGLIGCVARCRRSK